MASGSSRADRPRGEFAGARALADVLEGFRVASPELVLERRLLRRADYKFVCAADRLPALLQQLTRGYAVLRAGTQRVATYRTLYFDTPELQCFHDHRRGRRPRHKVRIRHYPDRHVSFFEIKTKQNETVTEKARIDIAYGADTLTEPALELVSRHAPGLRGPLEPQVWTDFRRVTLLGLATDERVTIDLDLCVGPAGGLERLDGLAIVEVKQSASRTRTPALSALRAAGLTEGSASKYCLAIALTRPGVRLNRFLPALRAIQRTRR